MNNGGDNIIGVPLISFEDVEHENPRDKPHPSSQSSSKAEHSNKKMKLFLSKGLFYVLGVLLFAVGCVLLVSFQHADVAEMCTLDGAASDNSSTSSILTSVSPTSQFTLPSPSSIENFTVSVVVSTSVL